VCFCGRRKRVYTPHLPIPGDFAHLWDEFGFSQLTSCMDSDVVLVHEPFEHLLDVLPSTRGVDLQFDSEESDREPSPVFLDTPGFGEAAADACFDAPSQKEVVLSSGDCDV
jgi:hypothetical protein